MNTGLSVRQVISRVFEIYVDQAPVLMPAAAVVFLITGILGTVLVLISAFLALLWLILSLIATTLFTGMVVELVADVQDGKRDASVSRLLRAVTPVLGQLILVGIVAGVGVLLGLVLLVVPGLILITIWAVAAPVVVLERPGVVAALRRSRELVKGHGWEVFAVVIVFLVGVTLASGLVEVLAASAAGAAGELIARVIMGVLTAPLSALAAAVLYFELGGGASQRPLSQEDHPTGLAA